MRQVPAHSAELLNDQLLTSEVTMLLTATLLGLIAAWGYLMAACLGYQ